MNVTIWIKDPFPMRFDEYDALQTALRSAHGSSNLTYSRSWPVDYVGIDNATMTTCKMIAATLKAVHVQQALLDKKYRGTLSNHCADLEIVIQGPHDSRPEWAKAS